MKHFIQNMSAKRFQFNFQNKNKPWFHEHQSFPYQLHYEITSQQHSSKLEFKKSKLHNKIHNEFLLFCFQ